MKVFISAGEVSGDHHGAELMKALANHLPQLEFYGVGGPQMVRAGLRPYYTIQTLQVHGIVEVLRHLPRLYKILWNLRDAALSEKPDLAIMVDYPGFNLKLAGYLKKLAVPLVFFNGPQIWAWRKGRLKVIQRVVDLMIVLFPFEENIYQQAGVPVFYAGHPLIDEALQADQERLEAARLAPNGDPSAGINNPTNLPVIALLPGSRPSEIRQHMPVIAQALQVLLAEKLPALFVVPVAESVDDRLIGPFLGEAVQQVQFVKKQFLKVIRQAHCAVVASGTATLQTTLARTPYVLIYRVAPFSYWLARKLASIQFLGIANILAGKAIVKELLQNDLTTENLVQEIKRLYHDQEYRQQMQTEFERVSTSLGSSGAYQRTAERIVQFLKERSESK